MNRIVNLINQLDKEANPSRAQQLVNQIQVEAQRLSQVGFPVDFAGVENAIARAMATSVNDSIKIVTRSVASELIEYAKNAVTEVKNQYASLLIKRGLEEATGTVRDKIGGTFTMAIRAYGEKWEKSSKIPIRYWTKFAKELGDLLEAKLLTKIKLNIRKSFDEGGRLSGDVEGSGKWKALSDKYVKFQKGGDRRFGFLSGGMLRNLYRGAIVVHFDKETGGAREFSIDFGKGKVGQKLSMFYHGRTRGRGKQPARPFTFIRRQDFNKIKALVKEHFNVAIEDTRRFFVGLAFGPMPTYMKFKEKSLFPRVHMRRITAHSGKK